MAKFKFTKALIDGLPPSSKKGWDAYYDEKSPGLALFVYPSGRKAFYVQRKLGGRIERIKIGPYPQTTIEQARNETTKINAAIVDHKNPADLRRALKAEPIFEDVFTSYLAAKLNRSGRPLSDRTKGEYRRTADLHLRGLLKLKLSQITEEKFKATHTKITSASQANKCKAIVQSVFKWVNTEGLARLPQPTSRVSNKFVASRERFLQPEELPDFFVAVNGSPLRDFFLLALLTGARRANIQEMRWSNINLSSGIWKIPKTKNGDAQTVTLTPEAVQILGERMEQRLADVDWVFPGSGKTGHLVEPKKAWAKVLVGAGIEDDLRIHDLRRTLGSYQARQGASLSIIGKSLGHKSQQATAIYARLDLDPVRQSVEQATAEILKLGKKG